MMRRLALRFRREERGAVMVIAAGAMLAMLAMAAFAIDVGSWYQVQRQAQGAADAAALAAAQDLPNGAAITDGQAYGNIDMACTNCTTITTPYNGSSTVVKATVTTTARSFFGGLLNVTSANVSASAVASETPGGGCSSPGFGCYAIYASDTNCSSNYSVIFNGAGDTITGGVQSNGSIDLIGGSQQLGPTYYSNTSGCNVTTGGSGDTFTSGPKAQAPLTAWPFDYSHILTACGGSGEIACTGPGGTPSYCTQAAASYDYPTNAVTTNNIYCAYGTGTKSDPSTWNGLIYFHSGSFGSSTTPLYGTWIGGTIEVGRQSFLAPQASTPNYPVFYATGSGNCSSSSSGGICMVASGSGVNGGMFAPSGTIEFNGGSGTANFLEAKDVNLIGGSFTGDGPTTGTVSSSATGSSALLQ